MTEDEWSVRFERRKKLGSGGMGTVYQVHHPGWGIDLALKIPRRDLLGRGGAAIFAQEAEAWASLESHPHVVDCYYVRLRRGFPWLVAELMEGGSLLDAIRDGRLDEGEAPIARRIDLALQIAYGLHHAHAHGLIHQDMKPANVLLTLEGEAKVADFGLAKVTASLDGGGDETETIVAAYAGMTPLYASPEQYRASQARGAAEPLTRRTDIWSWGLTVLETFAGAATWRSGTLAAQALAAYRAAPTGARMPTALMDLLARCFETDPDARPHDFLAIAEALRAIYEAETGEPARPVPDPAEDLADALNNRAVSLLDLGRDEEAAALFERALAVEPEHLWATYNDALRRWRAAELRDDEARQRLHDAHKGRQLYRWEGHRLMAWLHHESADPAYVSSSERSAEERRAGFSPDTLPKPPSDTEPGFASEKIGPLGEYLTDFAVSHDGTLGAALTKSGEVLAFDLADAAILGRVEATPRGSLAVDGARVVWPTDDGVALWDPATDALRAVRLGATVTSLAVDGGRAYVAAGGRAHRVELASGAVELLPTSGSPVVRISARHFNVAVARADGTIEHLERTPGLWWEEPARRFDGIEWISVGPHSDLEVGLGGPRVERDTLISWGTVRDTPATRLRARRPRHAFRWEWRYLVAWDDDQALSLWELSTGRCLRTKRLGYHFAYAPGAKRLFGAYNHGLFEVFVRDHQPRAPHLVARPASAADRAARRAKIRGHVEAMTSKLDAGDLQGALAVLQDEVDRISGARRLAAIRPFVERIAAWCSRYGIFETWLDQTVPDLGGPIVGVAWAPDRVGLTAVVHREDEGRLAVLHLRLDGGERREVRFEAAGSVAAVTVRPDGAVAVIAGGVLYVVPPRAEAPERIGAAADARDVEISEDGALVFVAGPNGVDVYDRSQRAWQARFEVADATDCSVVAGLDTIAIACATGIPALWSITDRRERAPLSREPASRVTLCADASTAALPLQDHLLLQYPDDDVPEGFDPLEPERVGLREARELALSHDGGIIAAITGEDRVMVVGPNFSVTRLGTHGPRASCVAITPDASAAVSGGRDGELRIWRIEYRLSTTPSARERFAAALAGETTLPK